MVTINKETLEKLRADLPLGSAKVIMGRLVDKFGEQEQYCIPYINKVLNPSSKQKNELIIHEAISLREELIDKRIALENRINSRSY